MVNSKKPPKNRPEPTGLSQNKSSQTRLNQYKLGQSRKSSPETAVSGHFLVIQLQSFLEQQLQPDASLLLALSGGLDSCVLLHLLAEANKTVPFKLHAMHVHHGLSPNADDWAKFCTAQCQQLSIPLEIVRLNIDKQSGLGIEATARTLRYSALFDYQIDGRYPDYIVTAHHQDDQAETLLLQLFRGAGLKGLSGMPVVDDSKRLLRPLLQTSRQTLMDYAQSHGLIWCEDESNDNTYFERNFVRHEIIPALEARNPSVKNVIARTASHIAEASMLLDDLAAIDAATLLENNSLCLQGLSLLTHARAKNCLRWWFANNQLVMPNTEHLNELLEQLLNAKPDANIHIELQHLQLKRFQHRAYLVPHHLVKETNLPYDLVWNGENRLKLPSGGELLFKQVVGAGLALKHGMTKLRITNRSGGERFKPDASRPTRTLKYLMQNAHIPPWAREQLPLVYWQDTLAYVPNIGVAADLQAGSQEMGLDIQWHYEPLIPT